MLLLAGGVAQAYREFGEDARTSGVLAQAYAVLQERAAAIPDPESHASFLNVPFNREVLAAYEQGAWPERLTWLCHSG